MSSLIVMLENAPTLTLMFAGLIGLMLGSFLNVVIYRLPLMLADEQSDDTNGQNPASFNLAWPGSHCPSCKVPVKAWQNIPVLSYLILKGRCHSCKNRIPLQYPLVELGSALLAIISLLLLGLTPQGLALFLVGLTLLALSMIDLNTFLLPDRLTLPLLWAGLLYQSLLHPAQLESAVWGAALGYLILWSIYWLFKLLTGKEGMGYGDFKLLAALGAWAGAAMLPALMLISALSGLLIGVIYKTLHRGHTGGIPFGPALALAGWLCLAFPDTVRSIMFNLFL